MPQRTYFWSKVFKLKISKEEKHEKRIKSYAHEQYNDLKISFLNDVADDVQNEKSIENKQIFVKSAHKSNEKTFKSWIIMSKNIDLYKFKQQDAVDDIFLIIIEKSDRRRFNV